MFTCFREKNAHQWYEKWMSVIPVRMETEQKVKHSFLGLLEQRWAVEKLQLSFSGTSVQHWQHRHLTWQLQKDRTLQIYSKHPMIQEGTLRSSIISDTNIRRETVQNQRTKSPDSSVRSSKKGKTASQAHVWNKKLEIWLDMLNN